ncbi:MAG: uracil-DNA glycosylase [Myxococcota bacterium]
MRPQAARQGELIAWLASAREWLGEFAEEGVERIEAAPAGAPVVREPESGRTPPAPIPAVAPAQALHLFDEQPSWSGETTLEAVRSALGDCKRCRLCEQRTKIVFGDGNPRAELMFVGEGPGVEEDRTGLPFVGRAGELLTAMIEKGLGIPRRDVYICNIVKCRPPGNRTPLADEAHTCGVFLDGQIAAVRPKVIVALGKPAASLLHAREVAITRGRGTWHTYKGIPLMPTFHPAFVLRQYTEENRRAVWSDLRAAVARIREMSS